MARPLIASGAVFVHARHEVCTPMLASCDEKQHERKSARHIARTGRLAWQPVADPCYAVTAKESTFQPAAIIPH